MLNKNIIKGFLLFSSLLCGSGAWAQGANSPYTILGVGRLAEGGSFRNLGMAGTGVSMGSYQHANFLNPALLTYNRNTTFEAGYFWENRRLQQDGLPEQSSYGGSLGYMHLSFPISSKVVMAFGVKPYSYVDFKTSQIKPVYDVINPGQIVNYTEDTREGEGGLNSVYFSAGAQVLKNLRVGMEASYQFGPIMRREQARIIDGTVTYVAARYERLNYRNWGFKPGFQYTIPLDPQNELSPRFNVGGVYTFKARSKVRVFEALQLRTTTDVTISSDTVDIRYGKHETLPQQWTAGVSFEKPGKYSVGLDWENQQWSEYEDYKGASPLKNAYKLSLGGEYTPDFQSVTSFMKRITWRAGFSYSQLPWSIAGAQGKDIRFTGGLSVPIGFSSVTLGAAYGWLDADAPGAIKENYFQINMALTVNDRFWFLKQRVN